MTLEQGRASLLPPILAILGGAANLIATAAIFVMPMYEGVSVTVTSSGERVEQHFRKTLLETQSLHPITILFSAAIIALSLTAAFLAIRAAPATRRRSGIAVTIAGVLLLFASFVSVFSVGAFYLPGALMVSAAGVLMRVTG